MQQRRRPTCASGPGTCEIFGQVSFKDADKLQKTNTPDLPQVNSSLIFGERSISVFLMYSYGSAFLGQSDLHCVG